MTLRAIWAQAHDRAIGAAGDMPWNLPEDLAYFKAATVGAPVIMGRRTWESFPPQWRPLPDRTNIVVTRNADFAAPGATIVSSLEEGIRLARASSADAWVIGGAQIYEQAMPLLDELYVTEIDLDVDGDAFAPEIGPEWRIDRADPAEGWHTSRTHLRYRFLVYTRA